MNYEELLAAYNELKKENALLKFEIRELRGKPNEPQALLFEPEVNTPSRPAITISPKIHINSHPKGKIRHYRSAHRLVWQYKFFEFRLRRAKRHAA